MEMAPVAIFAITIAAIIFSPFDKSLVAFAGLIAMILASRDYSFEEAFIAIDWNVMMILLGMWMMSGYLSKSGFPEYLVHRVSSRVSSVKGLILSLAIISAIATLFVDNVLVILLFGGLAVNIAAASRIDPLKASMIVGLSANYMGTGLLLGDLPPQLLHSVAGAEFLDFIWFRGLPSSLFLLSLSYLATLAIFARVWFRESPSVEQRVRNDKDYNKVVAWLSLGGFAAFMILASIRPRLGVELGAIAVSVGIAVAALVELYGYLTKRQVPSFEEVIKDMEWRVFLFYALLFSLVGGLKSAGAIQLFSESLEPGLKGDSLVAYSLIYWASAVASSIIEHDAVILVLLLSAKELSAAIDPWPLYWGIVWAGTLGSNATITGAPALYLSLILAEQKRGKVSWREWLSITLPFTIVSLLLHYIISLPIVYLMAK